MADLTWTGPKGSFSMPDTPENAARMRSAGYTTGDTMGRIRGLGEQPAAPAAQSYDSLQSDMRRAASSSYLNDRAPNDFGAEEAPSFGKVARDILPSVAAGAAGMLVPESIPLSLLARMAAAGLASTATDAGIQTARHQIPDASSLGRGALDAGGELGGVLLTKLLGPTAHALMSSGMSVPKKVIKDAVETRSALLGRQVLPHEIDLPAEAIKDRIAPGKKPWYMPGSQKETGARIMADTQSDLMTRRAQALADADASGATFTRQDFLDGFQALRREVASLPNGSKNLDALDNIADDFLQQGRVDPKAAANAKGNRFVRIKPSDVETMKEQWQAFAKRAYKGTADETLPILDKFSELVASNLRMKLEGLTPPAVPGGVGEIASLNRAYRANLPMVAAMTEAEMPRAAPSSLRDLNPVHLASPGARGRAALFLTEPGTRVAAHNLPRAAGALPFTLMDLLDMAQAQEQP